jgi:subtilisin family serine protease
MNSQFQPDPEEDSPLPFPGRTGRGVRIAVIDSGVNQRHPHIGGVAGGISLGPNGEIEEGAYLDLLGHGTAVMAAIQEKAPEAEYFAVKLFQATLRTTADRLIQALEWAIDQRMDVINLSLGTRNPAHAERFAATVEHAAQQGVLLVSARESDGEPCWPGCLAGVLGVGLDWNLNRNHYHCEETAGGFIVHASGYPRTLPGMPRERNLHGISFAVANMSGIVARACQDMPVRSSDAIYRALLAEAGFKRSSH